MQVRIYVLLCTHDYVHKIWTSFQVAILYFQLRYRKRRWYCFLTTITELKVAKEEANAAKENLKKRKQGDYNKQGYTHHYVQTYSISASSQFAVYTVFPTKCKRGYRLNDIAFSLLLQNLKGQRRKYWRRKDKVTIPNGDNIYNYIYIIAERLSAKLHNRAVQRSNLS